MLNKSMVLGIVLGLGLGLGLGLAAWKTPVWTIGWRVRSTLQGVSSMAPTAVIALQPHTRGRDRGIENNSNDAEEGLWTHHHPPVRQLGVSRRALVMIDMSVDQWAGVPAVVENTPFDHSKAATLSVVQALLANTTTTFDLIVVRISLVLTRPPSPPPLPPRPAFTESFTFQISMARSLALNVDGHPPLPPLRACLLFLSGRGITSCVMCAQDTRLLLDCGGTPMYNNRTPGPRTKSGSLLCNQWHKAARLHTAANYPGAALIPELRRVETAGNVTFVAKQEHSSFVRSTLDAQLRANGTRDLGENSPVGIGGHRWAWTRLSTSTPCPCRSHSVLHRHHRQSLSALARQPQALLHHRGRTGSDPMRTMLFYCVYRLHGVIAGIDEVFLVGINTDVCIMKTALDAWERGYRVVVVDDGCTSDDGGFWGHRKGTNQLSRFWNYDDGKLKRPPTFSRPPPHSSRSQGLQFATTGVVPMPCRCPWISTWRFRLSTAVLPVGVGASRHVGDHKGRVDPTTARPDPKVTVAGKRLCRARTCPRPPGAPWPRPRLRRSRNKFPEILRKFL